MSVLQGNLRKLAIKRDGGDWEDVAHVVSDSWQSNSGFLETTTRENAGYETSIPVKKSGSIQVSGIIFQDSDIIGKIGYKSLKEIQDNSERVEFRLQAENENFSYTGFCHIESTSDTAEVESVWTYEFTLKIYGKHYLTNDTEPPTTPVLSLDDSGSLPFSFANISWTSSSDNVFVTGYELEKSTTNNTEIINVGNVNIYEDTTLMWLTYYGYRVRAKDSSGNYSDWSNRIKFYLPIPLGQPTPNYKLHQDGTPKIHQNGIPKQYQA